LDGTATKHLWHVVQECDFTPPDAWNEDEDGQGMPTWLDVLCRFCGQSADGAGPTCPERLFWLTGSQREWDISEIDALAPGSGERPSTREGE
jgi:hypothetical protein